MAQRRIRQQAFRFGAEEERQTSLDTLLALLDGPQADQVMASLYPSAKGEKAWPPLAMFKALLLATWYDLSGVALAGPGELPPLLRLCPRRGNARTHRLRALSHLLVAQGLDQSLFEAIARDLESKGAVVRKGTSLQSLTAIASLIDAAVIASAAKGDKEAAWVKHKSRAPGMAIRRILRPARIPASSARSKRHRPTRPMLRSLLC